MEAKRKTKDTETDQNTSDSKQEEERETRALLRQLMVDAVPPVPRKLNRVSELYRLYLNVAEMNSWPMTQRIERLTLLRLVILQLLAPDIHRHGRHDAAFLTRLENWLKEESVVSLNRVEEQLKDELKTLEDKLKTDECDLNDKKTIQTIRTYTIPLLNLVKASQQHRSRFDPLKLLNLDYPSDTQLGRYYRLQTKIKTFSPKVSTRFESIVTTDTESLAQAQQMQLAAQLTNTTEFFDQLFSRDELAWRNALEQEQEQLSGKYFGDRDFSTLIENIKNSDPEFVQMPWLQLIESNLTPDQLLEVYKTSRLLQRLNQQLIDDNVDTEHG